jgi:hypothetical protein
VSADKGDGNGMTYKEGGCYLVEWDLPHVVA